MARPFIHPPLAPAKTESHQRLELPFQNRFTALAEYPRLPTRQPKLINLISAKPFDKGTSSGSSIQTKESYVMKAPDFFAQAVNPELTKPTISSPKEERFEFITSQDNLAEMSSMSSASASLMKLAPYSLSTNHHGHGDVLSSGALLGTRRLLEENNQALNKISANLSTFMRMTTAGTGSFPELEGDRSKSAMSIKHGFDCIGPDMHGRRKELKDSQLHAFLQGEEGNQQSCVSPLFLAICHNADLSVSPADDVWLQKRNPVETGASLLIENAQCSVWIIG
uniref:Uncharacterized protein n=1 Tax=Solanum tuberosum TaxID=4113 RepID=M1CJJ2_SOLTU